MRIKSLEQSGRWVEVPILSISSYATAYSVTYDGNLNNKYVRITVETYSKEYDNITGEYITNIIKSNYTHDFNIKVNTIINESGNYGNITVFKVDAAITYYYGITILKSPKNIKNRSIRRIGE